MHAAQLGWIHALEGRSTKEDTELAPLDRDGKKYFDIMEQFGYDWDWVQFGTYLEFSENCFGLTFSQMTILREAMIALKNELSNSSEEGTEPPYMSDDYRRKREKALEQAQKFNDDKRFAKRGK